MLEEDSPGVAVPGRGPPDVKMPGGRFPTVAVLDGEPPAVAEPSRGLGPVDERSAAHISGWRLFTCLHKLLVELLEKATFARHVRHCMRSWHIGSKQDHISDR